MSTAAFSVRPYHPGDAPQLERLYARVGNPYRPEDAAEVSAMQDRALRAQQAGEGWSPLRTDERHVAESAHLAFWVATTRHEIIGTVGLRRVGDMRTAGSDTAERSGLPWVEGWITTGDVGEVRRLRVAPEWRRLGVATALTRRLIECSAEAHALRSLVLNTTAAQIPALAFYRNLGFRELGRSYLGSYELVWLGFTSLGAASQAS